MAEKLKKAEIKSKSAKKFMKSETTVYKFFKIIMAIVFLYSGVFWGLIAVINLYRGPETLMANFMLFGVLLVLLSIVLAHFRRYILQFVVCFIGTFLYCYVARALIAAANSSARLETAEKLGQRHYPILIIALCSLILAIMKIWEIIKKKTLEKEKKRNAPLGKDERIVD